MTEPGRFTALRRHLFILELFVLFTWGFVVWQCASIKKHQIEMENRVIYGFAQEVSMQIAEAISQERSARKESFDRIMPSAFKGRKGRQSKQTRPQ